MLNIRDAKRFQRWIGATGYGLIWLLPVGGWADLQPAPGEPPAAPPPAVRWVAPAPLAAPKTASKSVPSLYSIGQPTDEEQLYLELINRARANPTSEGIWLAGLTDPDVVAAYRYWVVNTEALMAQFSTNPPVEPLAFNSSLLAAARGHSADMLAHVYQGHTGSDGSTISVRIAAAGYTAPSSMAENVFASAESVLAGHAGFNVDWGTGTNGTGMQSPPGHRNNILDPDFREVGVGVVSGAATRIEGTTTNTVGPQLVTQDFAVRQNATPLLTGVVYYDLNANGFYDLGEGLGGVRIEAPGANFFALSALSGGYALPVTGDGTRTVTFSIAGQVLTQRVVTVSDGHNLKLDYAPLYHPPVVSGPAKAFMGLSNLYSFTAVPGATNYQWRVARSVLFTAVEGAENGTNNLTFSTSPAYQVITNDTKASGAYSFHLAHPAPATPQSLSFKRSFLPSPAAQLRFASRLVYATTNQVARAQVSTNQGAAWVDVWTQTGIGDVGDASFTVHTVSLAGFAGQEIQVQFLYDYLGGGYYYQTGDYVGWHLDDITLTASEELTGFATNNVPAGHTFGYDPGDTATYLLRVRPQIPGRTLDYGPFFQVTGIPPIRLGLTWTATNGLIRWPTNPPGYCLQATRTVADPASWTNVPTGPIVLGTNYQIGIAKTNRALFLRLRQP